jgi:hypothetical protein
MEDEQEIGLHDQREINKMSLQTFHIDAELEFDYSIDKLMEQLKKENKKAWEDHDAWVTLEDTNPRRYEELKEDAERMDISLDLQLYGYIQQISFNDDQLTALAEMKIIYTYKLFEISIKKLIRAAFSIDTRAFYRWDNILDFLKEQGITINTLDNHREIIQLKEVNNALKHSDEMSEKLRLIPEFNAKESLTYIELNEFYKRVRPAAKAFIESLSHAIYKVLYEFDDEKLTKLVNSYVLRMDRDTAYRFAERIKSSY